jgi:hypothetical protein
MHQLGLGRAVGFCFDESTRALVAVCFDDHVGDLDPILEAKSRSLLPPERMTHWPPPGKKTRGGPKARPAHLASRVAVPRALQPRASLVAGHVLVSYMRCTCRADEGISGHSVVRCTTDGCRSAWYRPRHYPPGAAPSRGVPDPRTWLGDRMRSGEHNTVGSQAGSHRQSTQDDSESTEVFDNRYLTRHPATVADASRQAEPRSHRGSQASAWIGVGGSTAQ